MRARLSVHGVFAHMGEASLGWLSPNTSNALLCGSRGHARPQQGSPLMVQRSCGYCNRGLLDAQAGPWLVGITTTHDLLGAEAANDIRRGIIAHR